MTDAQNQIIGLLKDIAAGGGGGGAAWGGITGTLGDQTDLANALALKQTEAQVNALIAAAAPYKVYTALLTQSGTDAPVATVWGNTLGVTISWTYQDVGIYNAVPSVEFNELADVAISFGLVTDSAVPSNVWMRRASSSGTALRVHTSDSSGALADNVLSGTLVQILVKNP